ncbi:hypothetical protein CENSYa_1027 [Cenarchaeum symbiosum A]|uniref:Uncharacterized protein n=1 Tax=Cenarchaeum symbiosum (strain A) TaxID=414004 RepID=A0RWE2_CENSY|nr:hypothetical protein CENSYa_1027 [Cenarchaeum symbiosum A]
MNQAGHQLERHAALKTQLQIMFGVVVNVMWMRGGADMGGLLRPGITGKKLAERVRDIAIHRPDCMLAYKKLDQLHVVPDDAGQVHASEGRKAPPCRYSRQDPGQAIPPKLDLNECPPGAPPVGS